MTAGLAEIAAGSISMGLGGYLAGLSEIEHYDSERAREHHEVETVPEREREEVREIFQVTFLIDIRSMACSLIL